MGKEKVFLFLRFLKRARTGRGTTTQRTQGACRRPTATSTAIYPTISLEHTGPDLRSRFDLSDRLAASSAHVAADDGLRLEEVARDGESSHRLGRRIQLANSEKAALDSDAVRVARTGEDVAAMLPRRAFTTTTAPARGGKKSWPRYTEACEVAGW